jgi:cyclophilin family peptidyl-prolyl cis-trans isomerase
MKKGPINQLTRLVLITCIFLVLVAVALFGASYWQFHLTPVASVATPETELILGTRLEILKQGQMTSSSVAFNTDVQSPNALLLPLRTLADYEATPAATHAILHTSKGDLELELYSELATLTVKNFSYLAQSGFYDGLKIHRHEPGFVVQVGDPASRVATTAAELAQLGTGYPGFRIQDEIVPSLSLGEIGMVAMANINLAGQYPDTGGSQFFITLAPAAQLDGQYAIFGRVITGLEVLTQLEVGDEILSFDLSTP